MPKKITGLSELKIRQAKPGEKPYKLFDGDGLFLLITPPGGKLWRIKYRIGGKEKTLSLGKYPALSLAEARTSLTDAKKLLAHGQDPAQVKKADKEHLQDITQNTFEKIALEWFNNQSLIWSSSHIKKTRSRLDNDVLPWIGSRPIRQLTPKEILELLKRVESRGAGETAHRIKVIISQVFRFAIASERADADPTANLTGALQPVISSHFAAVTAPDKLGDLLRAIDGYQGTFVVKCALMLAPMLFVRPGELRQAEWKNINLEESEWELITSKTKTPLKVPLSTQAVGVFKELYPLTGSGRYVFPSIRSQSRPMSENAILAALRNMGYDKSEVTGHGFRATARTMLVEVLQFRPDIVEHQLGHNVKDPLGRAYNRAEFLADRIKMMQVWADYLDMLREGTGAKILPFKTHTG
ncbi:MAG: integrase arm-type DNA-binding domain-containing protein [Desulfamplus sp.]|nr:integrase arm-type DNA-binding domain-containing protein [Desulfamplus sp.]